jgi:endonuclease/exonuclease/phosphatase family metal-dependent hydrolase
VSASTPIRQHQPQIMFSFSVVSYNLFLRPKLLYTDAQESRSKAFANLLMSNKNPLKQADVIVLNELIEMSCFQDIKHGMRQAGYPHHTEVLGTQKNLCAWIQVLFSEGRIIGSNGGIVLFSKHPIFESEDQYYKIDEISTAQTVVWSGFIYVKIKLPDATGFAHVIAVHLNSDSTEVRQKQALKIRQYIESKNIDRQEPVLLAGDINEDASLVDGSSSGPWNELLRALDMHAPPMMKLAVSDQDYSYDPRENNLVGRDGYAHGPPLSIDHCFFSHKHLRPIASGYRILGTCISEIPHHFSISPHVPQPNKWHVAARHISDHFPVLTTFQFTKE